jgi:outer membrane protein
VKKYIIFLISLGTLFSFSLNCFGKELKIGYVDIFKVFNEYEKTKDYDKMLEEKKEKEEKKLDKKKEEIEKLQDKLALLKKEEQDKQRVAIAQAVKEYRQLEREILTDLKKERDEKMKEIIDDINKVIKEYAKKEGFDLIINENAILYGEEVMDITSEILRIVNQRYKK